MAFSVQHNPYFPMYPSLPFPSPDSNFAQKALALRQNFNSRLPNSSTIDLINSILANCATAKQPRGEVKVPYPPLGAIFNSPSWLHQALCTFQNGSIPRQLPEDLSVSVNSSKVSEISQPVSSKTLRKPLASPIYQNKPQAANGSNRTERSRADSLIYCQPTFYPILRDQVERVHQSWKTSDTTRAQNSLQFHETGTLVPSLIDGEVIMGFNVWGEKRLCLPHLFRFVLNDVDLKAIDEACTKLQITCTTCSPAQLTLLHARKILPQAVSSCGLIRKSDAERLTKFIRNRVDLEKSSILHARSDGFNLRRRSQADSSVEPLVEKAKRDLSGVANPSDIKTAVNKDGLQEIARAKMESPNMDMSSRRSGSERGRSHVSRNNSASRPIPVIHECFGSQLGLIYPELYSDPTAKCIECQSCHRLFAPDQFVGHTHKVTEVDNLNHWGFDSSNWRCYLRLYSGKLPTFSKGDLSTTTQRDNGSDDELDEYNSSQSNLDVVEAHRRLEEIKVKFAQPIRLPASLSAALRTVGLCASVAPIPPPPTATVSDLLNSCDTTESPAKSFAPPKVLTPRDLSTASSNSSVAQSPVPPPLPAVMLPQLTLRRLWAPNDGRIRVPPPPAHITTRHNNVLPKRLHTGPPLLLNSHRVISEAAAAQYDRDFIPNVCLMPPLKSKFGGIYWHRCTRGNRRSSSSRSHSTSGPGSSSSSRARSASMCSSCSSSSSSSSSNSVTSSSGCSYRGRAKRHCNGLSRGFGRNSSSCSSSEHSIRVDDDEDTGAEHGKRSTVHDHPKSRSHSWSHRIRKRSWSNHSDSFYSDSVVTVYSRQVSEIKHRRCHSYNTSISSLEVDQSVKHRRKPYSAKHGKHKRRDRKSSHRYSCCSPVCYQNRAMAAAKAAQGAAKRISPGLWSRHFANFGDLNKVPLNLPKAREPSVVQIDDSIRHEEQISIPSGPAQQLPQPKIPQFLSSTPVLVTNPNRNSLPSAVLALESVWADLVRHINDYTIAVESRNGVSDARQRLFEQFIAMQTCYATHIASLVKENQSLNEQLSSLRGAQVCPSARTTEKESPRYDASKTQDPSEHLLATGSFPRDPQNPRGTTPTVYPHRNRKHTRVAPNARTERNRPRSPAKQPDMTDARGLRTGDSDHVIAERQQLFHCRTGHVPQHRYAVSPIYTTSSSEDTTEVSTPTVSEPDVLLPGDDRIYHNNHSPAGFRVETLSINRSSPPFVAPKRQVAEWEKMVKSDDIRNQDHRCTVEAEGHASKNSRPCSDTMSPFQPPPKRRSLLPLCETRPRLTLKPQSKPVT